ncbi:MAG TPA: ABC transporter ATP-binding protein [Cyanobacteria bacterium UBA8543]|nr:ABC transporter ATP-binding protein [Cyanobacteria bacterium UBA8543]
MLLKIRQALQLRRGLHLVWQSSPGWTVASLALLVVQGTLPLLSLYLTKLMVDAVSTGLTTTNKAAVLGHVTTLVVLAGVVALVGNLCSSLVKLISVAQTQLVTDQVHSILQAKSVEVDLEYYENAEYYNALHLAQQEAPYRPTTILDGLIQVGQSGISLVAIAFLLFSLHWAIAAALFAAAIPGLVVRLKYSRKLYRKQREWTSQERRADYFNWMLTTASYAKEIRLFDLGSLFQERFRDLRSSIRQEKITLATRTFIAEWAIQASATLAVFGACGFIAYQTLQGVITLGSLVMYYQAFQRGQGALQEMLSSLASLYENSLFLSHLYEFLDLKRNVAEPLHPQVFPVPLQSSIQFEQVQFRYPNSTRPLIEDISMTIRAGETVALVGENGAGKTTLIKLLCRLYDPTNGRITVDGIDLGQFKTTDLRQEISVVFQDYAHYNLTARENIGFGDVNQLSDRDRVRIAARRAGVDKAIASLPYGYDTTLGREFEEGEELSIGEWQKVALARAFLRQSQIIVLDEPTSALDAKAEHQVFEQFRKLTQGRTAILISHRLSSIKLADRIYVLKDGTIVESGTHNELVQLKGHYAHMFEIQAQYYR